jgi:hypothetical protein
LRTADAYALLVWHDMPTVTTTLQDYVAAARSLENLRVESQLLLFLQPRTPTERQLFAEHAAFAVTDWLAAAPAHLLPSQMTTLCKLAHTQLHAVCAPERTQCTLDTKGRRCDGAFVSITLDIVVFATPLPHR